MGLKIFGQFDPVAAPDTRVTETDDIRITELGDTRVTNDQIDNAAKGSIVAAATLIPMASSPYIRVSGVWKLFVPYVKRSGTWQQPNAIYKKISGNWKRIY